jgi:hypothetical protein
VEDEEYLNYLLESVTSRAHVGYKAVQVYYIGWPLDHLLVDQATNTQLCGLRLDLLTVSQITADVVPTYPVKTTDAILRR